MKTLRGRAVGLLTAGLLLVACGGGGDGDLGTPVGDEATDTSTVADDTSDETAPGTMPDVIGMPVDEATAQLEEAGFTVSTGVVRTTEMEPDLVFRSEPGAGRQVREGQRVTLRVAAEPRD